MNELPIRTPFERIFLNTTDEHFNKYPRDWQLRVGGRIISDICEKREIRQLCVQPTGSGKSLLFQTIATFLKGITICLTPLLSLGADQVNKLMINTRSEDTTIAVLHLDECDHGDIPEIMGLIKNMKDNSTLFIFCSPQSITEKFDTFVNALIHDGLIRFVVVDEVHLFTHFGRSFRNEFNDLNDRFFSNLASSMPMLFLTATCTHTIDAAFQKMIGKSITHREWPIPSIMSMGNRRTAINVTYSSRPYGNMFKSIALIQKESLENELPKKVIVYSNAKRRIRQIEDKIGEDFDEDDDLHMIDIIEVDGALTKVEKSFYIQEFLDPDEGVIDQNRVLVCTSGVGNVGIDSPNIRAVYRLEFPPSIIDFIQEMGRAGRRIGHNPLDYSYNLYFSIDNFLHLFERTMNPEEIYFDPTYRAEVVSNLFSMARIIVLTNFCYYRCIEISLSYPYRDMRYDMQYHHPNCSFCPFCRKESIFPKVHRVGLTRIIFDVFNPGAAANPDVTNEDVGPFTLDYVTTKIREYPEANFLILRSRAVGGISPASIHQVLLILITAEIIGIHYHSALKSTIFSLARSAPGEAAFALMNDSFWEFITEKV